MNYLRFSVAHLAWDIVPLEGEELKKKHKTSIQRFKKFMSNPNPDDTWDAWLGQLIEDMLVCGWATCEIRPYAPGGEERPFMLWPVDGTSIQVDRDWDGSPSVPRYWQTNVMSGVTKGTDIPFTARELMVWKYVPRTNTPFGLSPVETAFNEIGYLLEALAFAGRTASNATPKKLLWVKGLNNDQLTQLRTWAKETIEGSGSLPMLGGDGDAVSLELGMTSDANLFLKWQEFLVACIANAFGVDVQKVNLIVGINRSTGDTLDSTTDSGSIEPLATMIEQYVNKHLLPLFSLDDVAEFKFRFTTSMSDLKTLATINQIETQDENATLNECRARIGKGPLLHPITGEDIGNVTVSHYRELIKIPEFRVHGWSGLKKALERQSMLDEATTAPPDTGENDGASGENSNNTSDDPTQRGGNGAYGAPNPKDKPLNRADEREES